MTVVQRNPEAVWTEVSRLGNGLADAMVARLPVDRDFRPCQSLRLTIERPALNLRTDGPPDGETAKRLYRQTMDEFIRVRGTAPLSEVKRLADRICLLQDGRVVLQKPWLTDEDRRRGQVAADLVSLRLNDLVLMGFPGETFWQTPVKAGKAAQERRVRFVSFTLANGTIGYIPTEADRPLGDYEVVNCVLGDGAEAKLEAAAKAMVERE